MSATAVLNHRYDPHRGWPPGVRANLGVAAVSSASGHGAGMRVSGVPSVAACRHLAALEAPQCLVGDVDVAVHLLNVVELLERL